MENSKKVGAPFQLKDGTWGQKYENTVPDTEPDVVEADYWYEQRDGKTYLCRKSPWIWDDEPKQGKDGGWLL